MKKKYIKLNEVNVYFLFLTAALKENNFEIFYVNIKGKFKLSLYYK